MSVEAREGKSWAPVEASGAAPSGSPVATTNLLVALRSPRAGFTVLTGLLPPVRFVRCRKDDHQFCAGGVPGHPRHPLLLPGRRQRPSRPEQEPGLLFRRPRGEHPPYRRGGQAVCGCRAGVRHQFHFSFHKGQKREDEKNGSIPKCFWPSVMR